MTITVAAKRRAERIREEKSHTMSSAMSIALATGIFGMRSADALSAVSRGIRGDSANHWVQHTLSDRDDRQIFEIDLRQWFESIRAGQMPYIPRGALRLCIFDTSDRSEYLAGRRHEAIATAFQTEFKAPRLRELSEVERKTLTELATQRAYHAKHTQNAWSRVDIDCDLSPTSLQIIIDHSPRLEHLVFNAYRDDRFTTHPMFNAPQCLRRLELQGLIITPRHIPKTIKYLILKDCDYDPASDVPMDSKNVVVNHLSITNHRNVCTSALIAVFTRLRRLDIIDSPVNLNDLPSSLEHLQCDYKVGAQILRSPPSLKSLVVCSVTNAPVDWPVMPVLCKLELRVEDDGDVELKSWLDRSPKLEHLCITGPDSVAQQLILNANAIRPLLLYLDAVTIIDLLGSPMAFGILHEAYCTRDFEAWKRPDAIRSDITSAVVILKAGPQPSDCKAVCDMVSIREDLPNLYANSVEIMGHLRAGDAGVSAVLVSEPVLAIPVDYEGVEVTRLFTSLSQVHCENVLPPDDVLRRLHYLSTGKHTTWEQILHIMVIARDLLNFEYVRLGGPMPQNIQTFMRNRSPNVRVVCHETSYSDESDPDSESDDDPDSDYFTVGDPVEPV